MRRGHGHGWHEHEDDDQPHARPNFAARLIAPANRLFTGKAGRITRWLAGMAAALVLTGVAVYVAFLTGLLSIDVATPWIVSALEEKLPPGHKVIIGKTRLDYDSTGAPVLTAERLEIRNDKNEEIMRAPSAEIGLEAGSLLMGNYRARRITLANAVMTIRLDEHGNIKVTTPKQVPSTRATQNDVKARPQQKTEPAPGSGEVMFAEVAQWLGRLERTGIDGIALAEVGLERGTLVVESDTPGRSWKFENINFSLRRPNAGGITLRLSSGDGSNPWELNASVGAVASGARAIDVIANRVVPNDLINAAGYGDMDIFASMPISGLMRAQIGVDGKLISSQLRIVAGKGEFGNARDARGRFEIDDAQINSRFDAERGLFIVDRMQISGGQNRLVLSAVVEPPKGGQQTWQFGIPQGLLALATGRANDPPLTIDGVMFRGGYDAQAKRLTIDEGVLRGPTTGLALSGAIDLSGEDAMLQLGVVAEKMPVSAFKRLWPAPIAPGTRTWVLENVESGLVERVVIALNLPLDTIAKPGIMLPENAIALDIQGSGLKFTPVGGLPAITEARATISVTGQNATVRVTNGVIDLGRKRRLTIPEGTFEVPQHYKEPPVGIVQLKIEGSGEAVADLLSRDILKGETGFTLNPDTTRGNVTGNVRIELPLKRELFRNEVRYAAEADVTNFSADNIVKGQKIEQGAGKITISETQIFIKGEGRLAGAPALFEYTKPRGKPDAEFRVATTLDEAARKRFGIELAPWLTGPITIRAQGMSNDKETRLNADADLTAATITELVPGWNKAPGRAARAQYRLTERDGIYKLDEINITGSGVHLRGSAELDSEGSIVSANLPTFQLSEGDRATLTVERNDGGLKVSLRGTVLDARGMLRSLSDAPSATKKKEKPRDVDLDVRIGAATGHNGEVIRNLELRVSRRNGEIRSFALLGRVGRDSTLVGELRARDGGRQVIYITSGDAGAVFRFADYYSKIRGGEIWIVLDTPTMDNAPQDGIVSVRDFNIVGEPAIDRLQSSAPPPADSERGVQRAQPQPRGNAVPFVRMRIDFTRTAGRFVIKEALIFGPTIGATVDGVLDYTNNSVQLRGTYVPAYGLNNLFGQIPLVGLFLGGPKEGLLALTFEITGPASAPTLRVNPISMAAPGFFRKIFEFRGASDSPGPLSPR
jgi:hypothetical protein